MSEIYLYEPKVPMEGGSNLAKEAVDEGCINLENIEFTYPTKKDT